MTCWTFSGISLLRTSFEYYRFMGINESHDFWTKNQLIFRWNLLHILRYENISDLLVMFSNRCLYSHSHTVKQFSIVMWQIQNVSWIQNQIVLFLSETSRWIIANKTGHSFDLHLSLDLFVYTKFDHLPKIKWLHFPSELSEERHWMKVSQWIPRAHLFIYSASQRWKMWLLLRNTSIRTSRQYVPEIKIN